MTDREKFQKTFSKLHASPDLLTEVMEMAEKRRYHIPKVAVAAIACVVILGSGTAAYAMNVGGIQRTIQIWIHGDQTDAQFVVEDIHLIMKMRMAKQCTEVEAALPLKTMELSGH